jgi:hypothetical protein
MKSKKKSPKPVTLLTRAERLLSDAISCLSVIEASVEKNVRELLVVAETSVAKAKDLITKDVMALAPAGAAPGRRIAHRKKRARRRSLAVRTAR